MLGRLLTVFVLASIIFFMFALYYYHFVKTDKSLESEEKECYNETNKDTDKVSPNQS